MEQTREEEEDEKEKERKKIFFDGLYALDGEDREEKETNEIATLLKESKQRNEARKLPRCDYGFVNARGSRDIRAVKGNLLRMSTLPDIASSVRLSSSGRVDTRLERTSLPRNSPIKDSEREQLLNQKPITSVTVSSSPTTSLHHLPRRSSSNRPIPTMPAKRKRVQSFQLRPESQQIFKGLSFFFIPNDDIDPARRLRILRAMEFGAVWVKEWREGISHIIADRRLTLNDVLKWFQWTSVPEGTILVNETYPIECLQFGLLLGHRQIRYLLEGDRLDPKEKEPSIEASTAWNASLQIKPVSTTHKVLETPSRSEENSVVDRVPQTVLPEPRKLNLVKKTKGVMARPSSNEGPKDPLEEAIIEAGKLTHLPLDSENEEDKTSQSSSNTTYDEENTSEDETERHSKRPRTTITTTRLLKNQSTYVCMQSHDEKSKSENPNARTVEILQEMADYYERINDTWRPIAYRKAISVLRKQPQRITTSEQASALPHIGERLAHKIEEIVTTDRLRRLENTKTDESNDATLQKFLGIYGVGFAQANQWVSQGHKTLEDLLRHDVPLNKNQRVGIEHYSDFNTRIPRSEVESLGAIVRNTAHTLIDADLQIIIMGSYRRGAPSSNDIDLIITKPRTTIDTLRTILLDQLIPILFKQNFLKVALASTSPKTGIKWHGACSLPLPPSTTITKQKQKENQKKIEKDEKRDIWRRIDFLLVPEEELGAAMIYFTGNDIFNRSLRLLARKKGMRLNQRGLFRDTFPRLVKSKRGGNAGTGGELVEGRSEKRIFEILGVPWRDPVERNA